MDGAKELSVVFFYANWCRNCKAVTPIFKRMEHDLDLSAGGVIDGTESIEEVGERVFNHVLACASGEVQAKAEETGHREFQVWAERAVSL